MNKFTRVRFLCLQIKKEKISNNILKEIEELNVNKVKKKLKRKG